MSDAARRLTETRNTALSIFPVHPRMGLQGRRPLCAPGQTPTPASQERGKAQGPLLEYPTGTMHRREDSDFRPCPRPSFATSIADIPRDDPIFTVVGGNRFLLTDCPGEVSDGGIQSL